MIIIWWSKPVGVILNILVCDIWINVLMQTSALVGPLYIVNWNARWNSERLAPLYSPLFSPALHLALHIPELVTAVHTHTPAKSCKVWLTLKALSTNKAVPETRVVRCQDRTIDGVAAADLYTNCSHQQLIMLSLGERTIMYASQWNVWRIFVVVNLCEEQESVAVSCHFLGAVLLVFFFYCPLLHLVTAFILLLLLLLLIIIIIIIVLYYQCAGTKAIRATTDRAQ
jgi:hypothetical protein